MRNKIVVIVVDWIFNDFILCFGFLEKFYYDMGGEFENCLFKWLEEFFGVMYFRIILYYL